MAYLAFEEWMDEINLDDLPPTLKDVADLIGLKNTIILAQKYQGIPLYLNMLDKAIVNVRDRKIKEEFNGCNQRQLANKYHLTEVWIRDIIKRQGVDDNQICLFANAENL